jgi:cytoskeletal protein RodZ
MPTVGQELRRERELRGVALSDIAKVTKIKLNLLQALEDDKLNILPGEFFIKGMIRAYARCIGLDEDQALNLYKHSLQQKEIDSLYESRRRETPILKSRRPNTLLIVAAALIVVAVSVLVFVGFGQNKGQARSEAAAQPPRSIAETSSPPPAHPQAPGAKVPKSKPETRPTQAPAVQSPAAAEPRSDVLGLKIEFQQETWIQVWSDGRLVLEGNKQPGEQASLSCRWEFLLNTGNAGGFTYTLNGRAGRSLGPPGGVVHGVRMTPENFPDYLEVR